MRSAAIVTVESGGVLRELTSGPPLTVRRVHTDQPGCCRLCLVNSAAGPLAGDSVALNLTLAAGAHVELVSAGAAIAQGRREPHTRPAAEKIGRLTSTITLHDNARLVGEPSPMIVCAGARVAVELDISVAATATLHWRELLVLGRSGEAGGSALLRWNVTRGGRPLLRQSIDLTDPAMSAWPGMLSGRRVLATALISDPASRASSAVLDDTAVRQRIDEHTVLLTVLDDDAATAQARLARLLAT